MPLSAASSRASTASSTRSNPRANASGPAYATGTLQRCDNIAGKYPPGSQALADLQARLANMPRATDRTPGLANVRSFSGDSAKSLTSFDSFNSNQSDHSPISTRNAQPSLQRLGRISREAGAAWRAPVTAAVSASASASDRSLTRNGNISRQTGRNFTAEPDVSRALPSIYDSPRATRCECASLNLRDGQCRLCRSMFLS